MKLLIRFTLAYDKTEKRRDKDVVCAITLFKIQFPDSHSLLYSKFSGSGDNYVQDELWHRIIIIPA